MANISIDQVSKSFGSTPVIQNLSLEIEDGAFLTLLGPSGCGKSTLLRLIAGLEKTDAGRIRVGLRDITHDAPKDRDVAMVFQSYALYPHLSVQENMSVPLRMQRLTNFKRLPLMSWFSKERRRVDAQIENDVRKVAQTLGIDGLLHRKPGQLSGGQRQRVAVGRAMVRQPKAFLMDEPLSNLDAKLRVHMRSEFVQLHRNLGTTFVYVTHDQSEAMSMSTKVAVMLGGQLMQVGSPRQIYDQPESLEVAEFVGSPKINVIQGMVRQGNLWAVSGETEKVLPFSFLVDDHRGALTNDTRIQLAFRSEQVQLVSPSSAPFRGIVHQVENLGSDVLVHVDMEHGGDRLIVRATASQALPTVGEGVGIGPLQGTGMLVFDRSGRRLGQAFQLQPAAPVFRIAAGAVDATGMGFRQA